MPMYGAEDEGMTCQQFVDEMAAIFSHQPLMSERDKILLARAKLRGRAMERARIDPVLRSATTFKSWGAHLLSLFKPVGGHSFTELALAQQLPSETVLDFETRLHTLLNRAVTIKPEDSGVFEKLVRSRFIVGLRPGLAPMVAAYAAQPGTQRSLRELVIFAKDMEAAIPAPHVPSVSFVQPAEQAHSDVAVNALLDVNKALESKVASLEDKVQQLVDQMENRCLYCGRRGHLMQQCYTLQRNVSGPQIRATRDDQRGARNAFGGFPQERQQQQQQ